ncbi:MAG: DUF4942 domain-containing protein [Natronospirillum sp.]|uniref:DUF4942 domain-containing protein n=1 Tax=Natronospirillum sp. TaxID=2812955 RepID=UPI0025CED26C|nr:DUF4942 domain-containing protein [Natronospirillum sp.]MCH8552498.1 DUF4942 domain-containing protein [Natronospirillum sp.]
MFGYQFYPTPEKLAAYIKSKLDMSGVRRVLDGSAGKGDLLNVFVTPRTGRRIKTLAIEIDPGLQAVLREQDHQVVDSDFLQYWGGDGFQAVVLNPPFADGDKHLLHAIDIMKGSGQIVCLLNAETLRNPYTIIRQDLVARLKALGADVEYFQQAFCEAERATTVEVALVTINMGQRKHNQQYFADMEADKFRPERDEQVIGNEVAQGDPVAALVERYEVARGAGLDMIETFGRRAPLLGEALFLSTKDWDGRMSGQQDVDDVSADFLEKLREQYWSQVLDMPQAQKYLTSAAEATIREQININSKMAFNKRNVHAFLERIVGGYREALEATIESLFDTVTSTHSYYSNCGENYYLYSTWKTNDARKISRKIILPVNFFDDIFHRFSSSPSRRSRYGEDDLNDLDKVLSYFSGQQDFVSILEAIATAVKEGATGDSIESTFFKIRIYRKGTTHLVFKDTDALRRWNIFVGTRRNWLFKDYGQAPYETMTSEQQAEVEGFEGKRNYAKEDNIGPRIGAHRMVSALIAA